MGIIPGSELRNLLDRVKERKGFKTDEAAFRAAEATREKYRKNSPWTILAFWAGKRQFQDEG